MVNTSLEQPATAVANLSSGLAFGGIVKAVEVSVVHVSSVQRRSLPMGFNQLWSEEVECNCEAFSSAIVKLSASHDL